MSFENTNTEIKLTLHDVKQAVSIAVMDIVFYKDDYGKLYRLYSIKDAGPAEAYFERGFHHIVCLGDYAPDIIEGKIELENEYVLKVRDKNGDRYKILKNAEKFEFWDAS